MFARVNRWLDPVSLFCQYCFFAWSGLESRSKVIDSLCCVQAIFPYFSLCCISWSWSQEYKGDTLDYWRTKLSMENLNIIHLSTYIDDSNINQNSLRMPTSLFYKPLMAFAKFCITNSVTNTDETLTNCWTRVCMNGLFRNWLPHTVCC